MTGLRGTALGPSICGARSRDASGLPGGCYRVPSTGTYLESLLGCPRRSRRGCLVRRGRVIWSVSVTQTMWLTTPFQARMHVSSLPAERPPRDAVDAARGRWLPNAPSPWLTSGGAITEHVPAGLDGQPHTRAACPLVRPRRWAWHCCICVMDMSTTQTPSSPPYSEDGLEITAHR